MMTAPSALSYVDGLHTALLARVPVDSDRDASAGFAFAASTGRGLGGALSVVHSGGDLSATQLWFGASAGTPRFSVGWAMHHVFAPSRTGVDGFRAHDLSFTARTSPWLALAAGVRNLGERRTQTGRTFREIFVSTAVRDAQGYVTADLGLSMMPGAQPESGTLPPSEFTASLRARLTNGMHVYSEARAPINGGIELARVTAGVTIGLDATVVRTGVEYEPGQTGAVGVLGLDVTVPHAPDLIHEQNLLWRIDLGGTIPERSGPSLLGGGRWTQTDLLIALDRTARNRDVDAILLKLTGITSGGAQLEELHAALTEVRAAGIKVIAWMDQPTLRDLYIASAADLVLASPATATLEAGIVTTRTYLGDLLANVGVEAQFVRIGDFKSGPERFTRSGPSDEATAQLDAWLDDLWTVFSVGLEARLVEGVALDTVLADSPLLPGPLAASGLIDGATYVEGLSELLSDELGDNFRVVDAPPSYTDTNPAWLAANTIAILHIDGDIVRGPGGFSLLSRSGRTGSDAVIEACEAIADDRSIGAVILRIDSPGGSALASDDMQRALAELDQTVPVVVSMGDIAASGGYYVAALDAPVFASRATLTGSIGIYAGTFAVDGLLDWIGVDRVSSERGGPASFFDGRRWDEERLGMVQESIAASYATFIGRVAAARERTPEEIDAIAQGRIWSGVDALEVGLVDELGGFAAAWDAALETAGLRGSTPVRVRHFPRSAGLPLPLELLAAMGVNATREPNAGLTDVVARLPGGAEALNGLDALLESADGAAQARLDWVIGGL